MVQSEDRDDSSPEKTRISVQSNLSSIIWFSDISKHKWNYDIMVVRMETLGDHQSRIPPPSKQSKPLQFDVIHQSVVQSGLLVEDASNHSKNPPNIKYMSWNQINHALSVAHSAMIQRRNHAVFPSYFSEDPQLRKYWCAGWNFSLPKINFLRKTDNFLITFK